MATTTDLTQLKINLLTEAQYDGIVTPAADELYMTPDQGIIYRGLAASKAELDYVSGVTSAIQTQINGKAASSHTHGNITNAGAIGSTTDLPVFTGASGVLTTKTAANALTALGVTATAAELNYVDGVTSSIQTQLEGKVPTSRTVNSKALSDDITLSASDVGAASSTHTHSAGNINAGTLAGRVQANATAAATLANAQVRSIYAGTADLTAGSSTLATGTLYFVYE